MSTGKRIYVICVGVLLLAILIAAMLIGGIAPTTHTQLQPMGYEDKLFAQARIHSIDIFMEDWDGFLQAGANGQYAACSVVINKERFDSVGIRIEEDASLAALAERESNRHSLVLEFDRYNSGQTYHGLDTLNLDNLYQDNSMMKDYLTYHLMNEMNVPAPLCSYTKVYVNEKSLGLYLAVEAVEDSFLQRNYGSDHGVLYKPETDSNFFDHAAGSLSDGDRGRLIQSLKQLNTGGDLQNILDIDAVVRYLVVHTYVCGESSDRDTGVPNCYLYEQDGRLSVLPRDYSLAFGGNTAGDNPVITDRSIHDPVPGDHVDLPLLSRILDRKKYTWLYERYFLELAKVKMENLADQTSKMIRPYVYRDPSRFCTFEEFEAGVDTLKRFLELRTESVQQQVPKL